MHRCESVPHFKIDLVKFSNACCDLENDVKVKCVICPERPCHGWYFDTIKQVYLFRSFAMQQILFPIRLTLERWTLAYKSEVKGQSDLIFWLKGDIDQRYIHAWLEVSICTDVKTCPTSKLAKSNFFNGCLIWPWKWGQGQMCHMSRKALPWVIFWHNKTGLPVEILCDAANSVPH